MQEDDAYEEGYYKGVSDTLNAVSKFLDEDTIESLGDRLLG